MSNNCTGNGACFDQCCCICYEDEECEIPSEVCTCGHRDHPKIIGGPTECDIYCREECSHDCQLVECHNFRLCGKKEPQVSLDHDNGMCMNCAVKFGRIKFLDTQDDCPICLETKDMIQISCGKHNVCLDCWKQASATPNRPIPLSCPLCRESIWKSK